MKDLLSSVGGFVRHVQVCLPGVFLAPEKATRYGVPKIARKTLVWQHIVRVLRRLNVCPQQPLLFYSAQTLIILRQWFHVKYSSLFFGHATMIVESDEIKRRVVERRLAAGTRGLVH